MSLFLMKNNKIQTHTPASWQIQPQHLLMIVFTSLTLSACVTNTRQDVGIVDENAHVNEFELALSTTKAEPVPALTAGYKNRPHLDEYAPDTAVPWLSLVTEAEQPVINDTINEQASSESNDESAENIQAAESTIRDTDMASQMVEFTKDQILSQASTAMLAQANQRSQSVMQLLQ